MQARTRHSRFQFLPFGIHVLAGAVGVLAGIHCLLSSKDRVKQPAEVPAAEPVAPDEVERPPVLFSTARENYFAIRRTKSELGYVYWVLQGFGEFRCYLLCDSWREAMDEANIRIQNYGGPASVLEELAITV